MPYFDTSLTTSASVNQGILGITKDQGIVAPIAAVLPPPVVQSLTSTLSTTVVDPLTTTLTAGENYLRNAIQSTTATFDTAVKSLASGISPSLASIFTNTNNPQSSTTTTLIPDAVTTNLLNKKSPGAGTFIVNSLQTGSGPLAGATSIFGTGAALMKGTTLTTLLNRFNLDFSGITRLPTAVITNSSANRLNGLFATLSVGAGNAAGAALGATTGSALVGGVTSALTTGITASALGVTSSPIVTRAIANDLSIFLGNTDSTSKALGNPANSTALSKYFVTNPSYSLIDTASGAGVNSHRSGVDATTANAISQTIAKTGCVTNITNYGSAHVQASSFNLSLELAALNGLSDLVSSLLGCSHASTPIGQQSLGRAFTASSGSQIGIAAQILQSIQSPAVLNTPTVRHSILTNPTLTLNDVGTVASVFGSLGTTTRDAYADPTPSSPLYPVYDVSLLSQSPPDFVRGAMGTTDFNDYFNGSPMTIMSDGTLNVAA